MMWTTFQFGYHSNACVLRSQTIKFTHILMISIKFKSRGTNFSALAPMIINMSLTCSVNAKNTHMFTFSCSNQVPL